MIDTLDLRDETERATFERDGYVLLPGVLGAGRVRELNELIDRVLDDEGQPAGLNMFQSALKFPEVLALLEEDRVLSLMVNHLGFNLQLASSVISVHRAEPAREAAESYGGRTLPAMETPSGAVLNWHRDGPSPRFPHVATYSAKVAFVLTDLTEPERGNTKVIPGSHRDLDFRPALGDPHQPVAGEVQVTAAPGDAYLFTQNLWHAAPLNRSTIERRVIFIGFSSTWARPLDYDVVPPQLKDGASPVMRQLLGEVGPTVLHHFMPDSMPLQRYWRGGEVVHSYA